MKISVVVPIYNQRKILPKTIDALCKQTMPRKDYEVILVDNGSTDGSERYLGSLRKKGNLNAIVLKTRKYHGRASARNLGVKVARSKIILLIDGDIIATKELLLEHLLWHKKFPKDNFSVLGHITWSSEINITSFMYWLEHGGRSLAFDDLTHGKKVDYTHFYSGNISLKKGFLLKNGLFDESFGRNIFEDLELAYRLNKKGLEVIYNKKALGYHYHLTNPKEYGKRMEFVGKGARILFKKHPELKDKIALTGHNPRTIMNQIFSPAYFVIGKIFNSQKWMGFYYNARFFRCYLEGYGKKK